jgi:hypothetical protein
MASIWTDKKTGLRRILFDLGEERKSIRMGRLPLKKVNEIKGHIEHLANEFATGKAVPLPTAEWLEAQAASKDKSDKKTCRALVKLRLASAAPTAAEAKAVESPTVAEFIDSYIAHRRGLKSTTVAHLKRARDKIVSSFGEGKLLADVTVGDSKRFRETLAETQAPNTVRRICGRAKQFFQAAVDDGRITISPFAKMKDTAVKANKSRDHE